ncbi:probable copper-transporting ATPase HMA5 [Ricinus communis]|uniref:Copper-transporting atpase p-type, putative n=1 Tax=Ricinus communis TaxID=3988 RepID=B9RCA0_RICCO|nr:probable copper-transporting ATPase HMA5 [Ricinus communis]EEF51171.1 copper-transporting atpase p-type, putative [Ricinus communis]|eukprot:XP_002509784.1 probable copper-transporting ATPase HMA5 [Ricinus communis]
MHIGGLTTTCSFTIEQASQAFQSAQNSEVEIATEESKLQRHINYLLEATDDPGFRATIFSSGEDTNYLQLKVDGMLTDHSVAVVKNCLQAVPAVQSIDIDPVLNTISISYKQDIPGFRSFVLVIKSTANGDLRAMIFPEGTRGKGRGSHMQEETKHFRCLLWSLLFSFPLFLVSMVFEYIPLTKHVLDGKVVNMLTIGAILRWVLSAPVQFLIGRQFYVASFKALQSCSVNLDVLIALKTNTVYLFSVYSVMRAAFSPDFEGNDFFGTSSMFIAFSLLGKYLDVFANRRKSVVVNKALEAIILLTLDEEGNVTGKEAIDAGLMQQNHLVNLNDGSMIGGTETENRGSRIKATRVGSGGTCPVESTWEGKGPVQEFADNFSKYFVILVSVLSISIWLAWFLAGQFQAYPDSWLPHNTDRFHLALQFGISVMLIASPCALFLAIPIAVMVGTEIGAFHGVLFKSGQALENARKVNRIIFSKSALTVGKPEVVSTTHYSKDMVVGELLELVAAAEAKSKHPLAKAILAYARKCRGDEKNLVLPEAQDFVSIIGRGVKAVVQNKEIIIGNRSLMFDHNIVIPVDVEEMLAETEGMAQTGCLIAINREVTALIAIFNPLKPGTEEVITILKSMKVQSIMLTGDNKGTANAIAKEIGIETVIAEAKAERKAERVKKYQDEGNVVAIVGDFVDDSPALVVADVGIAIGSGTKSATGAADIVLIRNNLEDVITALDLSKKTFIHTRLNCIWAVGHNLLAIPVAAGALFPGIGLRFPPWIAGAAAAGSSAWLVICSYLLKRYKRPTQLENLSIHGIKTE